IHVASNQTFFAHRRDSSNRHGTEMHNEAERGRLFLLQFFERRDYRHNLLWTCASFGPIGKKTIAKIFVNYPVLIFDNLLATKYPFSEKKIQVLARHLAAEGGKTAKIRDKKPAGDIFDLPRG